jgi:hypothetical protein
MICIVAGILLAPALASAQVRYRIKEFERKGSSGHLFLRYPEIQSAPNPMVKERLTSLIMDFTYGSPFDRDKPAKTFDDFYERFLKWGDETRKAFDQPIDWEVKRTVELLYESPRVVSLEFVDSQFDGGAHSFPEVRYVNLRAQTAEPIGLKDIVKEGEEANLARAAERQLRADRKIPAGKPMEEEGFFIDHLELSESVGITRAGILFFYGESIANHAMSPVDVTVPYAEAGRFLKPELGLPTR